MKMNDLHILFTVTVPWTCVCVRYVKGVCSLVGMEKENQATAFKAKCAHVLNVSAVDLQSTDSGNEDTSCSNLDILNTLLKDKVKVTTKQEKIKLLTPESWTKPE